MDSRDQKAYWVKITNKMSPSQISTLIDKLIKKAGCSRTLYYCYDSTIGASEYLICAEEHGEFLKIHSTTSPIGNTIMTLDEEISNLIEEDCEKQMLKKII